MLSGIGRVLVADAGQHRLGHEVRFDAGFAWSAKPDDRPEADEDANYTDKAGEDVNGHECLILTPRLSLGVYFLAAALALESRSGHCGSCIRTRCAAISVCPDEFALELWIDIVREAARACAQDIIDT